MGSPLRFPAIRDDSHLNALHAGGHWFESNIAHHGRHDRPAGCDDDPPAVFSWGAIDGAWQKVRWLAISRPGFDCGAIDKL